MHDFIQPRAPRPSATASRRALWIAACLLSLVARNARGGPSAPVAPAKAPVPADSTAMDSANASARPTAADAAPASAETLVVKGPGGAVEPW